MEKRRLSWIIGLPVMASLVALPYLFKPTSNQQDFNRFKGAMKECSVAEQALSENPSEQNKKAFEKAEKKFQKLDERVVDVDYVRSKVKNDLSRIGYFYAFHGNSSQKFYPIEFGKIVEKGTFDGKNKKLDYVVFEREIGNANNFSWLERAFIWEGDKWSETDLVPIDRKYIRNEAKFLYEDYKENKLDAKASPRDKLKCRTCRQIFDEIGTVPKDKEKEIFIDKYFETVKKEILYHESSHLKDNSEVRAALNSLINAPAYSTFEALYQWQELDSINHKKAAEIIFKEYAKRGITKEKLPETSLRDISKIAKAIYETYKE